MKRQSNDATGSMELDVDDSGGGGGGGGDVNITQVGGSSISLGQKTMANSYPVVIASDQSAVPVSAVDFDIRNLTFATDKADVSGSSVSVSNFPASQPVSGTVAVSNFPATQPVSATDLDIRNLIFATDKVDVSGSTGVGVTGPLTDTQLRATPVPVSGTVATGGLTDTQLRASAVPVSATDLDIRNLLFASDKVDSSGSAIGAGTALIGKVGIDQTTPGTTNAVSLGAVAVSSAVTSVNDSASSQQLLASLATRKGYKLYNDSTKIAFVKEGTTATTSDYSYRIQPQGFYESVGIGIYTGRIDCIWESDGSGAMKVTELT